MPLETHFTWQTERSAYFHDHFSHWLTFPKHLQVSSSTYERPISQKRQSNIKPQQRYKNPPFIRTYRTLTDFQMMRDELIANMLRLGAQLVPGRQTERVRSVPNPPPTLQNGQNDLLAVQPEYAENDDALPEIQRGVQKGQFDVYPGHSFHDQSPHGQRETLKTEKNTNRRATGFRKRTASLTTNMEQRRRINRTTWRNICGSCASGSSSMSSTSSSICSWYCRMIPWQPLPFWQPNRDGHSPFRDGLATSPDSGIKLPKTPLLLRRTVTISSISTTGLSSQ